MIVLDSGSHQSLDEAVRKMEGEEIVRSQTTLSMSFVVWYLEGNFRSKVDFFF